MANAPNVATGSGSIPTVKAKAKKPKTTTPAPSSSAGAGKYQWATGGKVHNISQAQHNQNVNVQRTLGTNDLTAPPTGAQAIKEANASADMQYAPQIQAAQQLQTNLPGWYADYLARVAGYAKAANTMAAPVIAQAQAYQQNAGSQVPAGIDPNSVAGQQAAQAAQGRQALGQLGLDSLNTANQATQDYFGGQQQIASKELPQAQTAAGQQLASAQSQRGAAVSNYLTTARTQAENYAIARGTLGLNATKEVDATTAATDAAKAKTTADDNKVITSGAFAGLTNAQVRALDATTKTNMRDAAKTPAATEKPYSSGAFAGMKPSELARHSRSWIQGQIDDYNQRQKTDTKKPPSASTQYDTDFYSKYGVKPVGTGQIATAHNAIKLTDGYVKQLVDSGNDPATIEQILTRGGKVPTSDGKTMTFPKTQAIWVQVALDIQHYGGVTNATADQLHHMGYSVEKLGLQSAPPQPKATVGPPLTNNPITGAPNPLVK